MRDALVVSDGRMRSVSPSVLPRIFSPSSSPAVPKAHGPKSDSLPRKRRSHRPNATGDSSPEPDSAAEARSSTQHATGPAHAAKAPPPPHPVGSPWLRAFYGTYEAVHNRLVTPGTTPGGWGGPEAPEAGVFLVAAAAVVLGQLTVLVLVVLLYLDVRMVSGFLSELSWALLFSVALAPSRDALLEVHAYAISGGIRAPLAT